MNIKEIRTIIFIGKSGSGKGTQIDLLRDYLKSKHNLNVELFAMGEIFRSFFKEEGYVQEIAKELSEIQGKFQPDFLADALFVSRVVKTVEKDSVKNKRIAQLSWRRKANSNKPRSF